MFIFNFKNLGLITLNLVKKKTVDIMILLISLHSPPIYCQQLPSMTDALREFAVEVTCEPSLNNFPKQFSSVIFYITFTNI